MLQIINLRWVLIPIVGWRLTYAMKTLIHITEIHLTQVDLDRVATPEEAESLPLRCHEEDCFVHGSELGVVTAGNPTLPANPSTSVKK